VPGCIGKLKEGRPGLCGRLYGVFMDTIRVTSFAKINLTLDVSAQRSDGYHDIDSVVQIIDIRDELVLSKAEPGVIDVIVESGDAPSGSENLVYKACAAFIKAADVDSGVRCVLRKTIPSRAGLGGGSGNGAAAIAGLNRLFGCEMPADLLGEICAMIGSDAPLFIYGGTVRMRGRGDIIESLPDAPEMSLVVVKPEVGVSTAWAYNELDKQDRGLSHRASDRAERAVRDGDSSALIECLSNDFDPVVCDAFEPVRLAKDRLTKNGARAAMLSGSGSAVFGVFGSENEAASAAEALRGDFAEVFCTRSLNRRDSALVDVI